jgi:hypothetical protein
MTESASGALQPFVNLAQANMAALTKFSTSPEISTFAFAQAQRFLEQGPAAAAQSLQTGAFSELAQGLVQNWQRFAGEVMQAQLDWIGQSQAGFMQQAQAAGDNVVDVAQRRRRA